MADVSNPIINDFINRTLRPMAEKARDMQAQLTEAATEYATIVSQEADFTGAANDDVFVDGRASEGVYQVTKLDLTQMLTHLSAILTTLDTAGADALRAKYTVRPLRV